MKSVKRTTEIGDIAQLLSAVRFTDYISFAFLPAVNCWAIVSRPLRGLVDYSLYKAMQTDFPVLHSSRFLQTK
jgi:hypothetical protein